MQLLKKYLGTITIAFVLGVVMGIVFHSTKYFLRRLDGILVEVSHKRFLLKKKTPKIDESLVTEYTFNIESAILSFIIILIIGIFIRKYKGANQKRNVAFRNTIPKETNQNIRENLPPESSFMG